MPRAKLINRPRKLTIHLAAEVAEKLELFLFSEVRGKVPEGAYQRFFTERINEFFATKEPKNDA